MLDLFAVIVIVTAYCTFLAVGAFICEKVFKL